MKEEIIVKNQNFLYSTLLVESVRYCHQNRVPLLGVHYKYYLFIFCLVQTSDLSDNHVSSTISNIRRRQRSNSMNSHYSSSETTTRSISCEELPKPVCRKHSTNYSGSNFNLVFGTPTTTTSLSFNTTTNDSLQY